MVLPLEEARLQAEKEEQERQEREIKEKELEKLELKVRCPNELYCNTMPPVMIVL